MAIGRNLVRVKAPLPQGLLIEQGYRWAKLFTNWLMGFSDTTAVSTATGSATFAAYNCYLSVSANTSVGQSARINFQVLDAFGSAQAGTKQFRMYTANSKYDRYQIGKNPSIIMSVGETLEKDGSMRWANMRTNSAGRCLLRLKYGAAGNSAYVHAMVAHGKPYTNNFKLIWTPVEAGNYLWWSVGIESSNWIPIHVEARLCADNTRFRKCVTIAHWFAGSPWGIVGNVPSVQFSGGAKNIATLDNNPDCNWLSLSSTSANIIKINQVGNIDWYAHGVFLNGRAFVASTKADFT